MIRPTPRSLLHLLLGSLTLATQAAADGVRDFGARGDGIADDTPAIEAALRGASDGAVDFPRGRYRITRTIEIDLAATGPLALTGRGGAAVVMAGPGPAFRFIGTHARGTADPRSVAPGVWDRERMPLLEGLELTGDHPEADGAEFRHTLQATIRGVLVRGVRHGLRFSGRNRNVLVSGVHVYACRGIGIFLDAVNLHQISVGDSHLSYCRGGGIRVAGGEIRNFQITGNDIEYNFAPDGPPAADIAFDFSGGGSIREGTITGNTVQALPSPGGANIRIIGVTGDPLKAGVWSISGNHLANQETCVHLRDASGVTITGNTFMRGFSRQLVIERSRNVIVSANVFDRNADYHPPTTSAPGGIVVEGSAGIILSGNVLEGSEAGTAESGGALTVTDCREVTLSGNQIRNPRFRGIHLDRSNDVRITDNLVSEQPGRQRMLAALELAGDCAGTMIGGNSLSPGSRGAVVNRATGVAFETRATP